jgi:hypothetical protein
MWVQSGQFQQIDSALDPEWAGDIDRLLADILRTGVPKPAAPAACGACRRELVRSELLPSLVAFACPAGHGAWMSADALVTLRRFVRERGAALERKRRRIWAPFLLAAAAIVASGLPRLARRARPSPERSAPTSNG